MILIMAHVFYTPHKNNKFKNKEKHHVIDKLIYLIAIAAPLMTIPQLLEVWTQRKTQGVSLLTWGAYAAVSFLWVVYGLFHKEKPIILTNLLLFLLDFSIVLGVLLYR